MSYSRDDVFKAIDVADEKRLTEILTSDSSLASSQSDDGLSAVLFTLYLRQPQLTDIILAHDPKLGLFDLVALGRIDLLDLLLKDRRVDMNIFSGDGFSPLHLAAFFNQFEVVHLLIKHGADVNIESPNGSNLRPLHSAVTTGNKDITEILLAGGADPNVCQAGGYTPLMAAVSLDFPKIVDLLLANDADMSLMSDDGRRAIDFARSAGLDHMTKRLS